MVSYSGLISDAIGNLYGTTVYGGKYDGGTVFRLSPPPAGSTQWTQATLFSFNVSLSGANPNANPIFDTAGNLYGTTIEGGNHGTVFKLTPPIAGSTQWTRTTLTGFNVSGTNGAEPIGSLVLDTTGNLYGTTFSGGKFNAGTVFKLTPPAPGSTKWTRTTLVDFSAYDDGGNPAANLIFDTVGNLYGTTFGGGVFAWGTVFKLTPPTAGSTQWTRTTLVNFNNTIGGGPRGGLISDSHGNLYGTTSYGPYCETVACSGTVFKLTPPTDGSTEWTHTVLVIFNNTNGATPRGSLVRDTKGNLYGTTMSGGAGGGGTVFKLTP